MWALLILSPFKGFSSRNRREVPRRAPHRRHSAHRRPPIAPTLPPPGRQVSRGAGAAGSLQPFVEILPNDFAVPSSCIPQSNTGTLSSSSYPGHLQSTTSHSSRAKDRNAVCFSKLVQLRRASGSPLPHAIGAASGEATFTAKIYLAALASFRNLRRCDRERRLDCKTKQSVLLQRISTSRRASGPRRERTMRVERNGTEVSLPFGEEKG